MLAFGLLKSGKVPLPFYYPHSFRAKLKADDSQKSWPSSVKISHCQLRLKRKENIKDKQWKQSWSNRRTSVCSVPDSVNLTAWKEAAQHKWDIAADAQLESAAPDRSKSCGPWWVSEQDMWRYALRSSLSYTTPAASRNRANIISVLFDQSQDLF